MLPELFLATLLLTGPHEGPSGCAAPAPTLFVSKIDGLVTATRPDGGIEEVRNRQVLPAEWRLTLPPRSLLAGVCSNDRRLRLRPPAARAPIADVCFDGRIVAAGTYRALAHGRLELATERVHQTNVRILSMPIRGSEETDPLVPTLLDPRETLVLDARPRIHWTRVHGAVEYVVELAGAEPWSLELDADEVPCTVEEHPPNRLEICSVPWPEAEGGLPPGEAAYLTIGARTGRVTPLRAGDARTVTHTPKAVADSVAESLDALEETDFGPPGREIRRALVLAGLGLISDAGRILRESLIEHPTAEGFLLLGSLDLERELPHAAIRSFRRALELAPEPLTSEGAAIEHHAREGLAVAQRSLSRGFRAGEP